MELVVENGVRQASSTSPRRESPIVEHDAVPKKKSRKSTIMEALRRGASLAQEQVATGERSRQLSTVASMATDILSTTPMPSSVPLPPSPSPPRAPSPAPSSSTLRLAPTGLPFYTHTEFIDLVGLPPVLLPNVHYFRYGPQNRSATEDVNLAVSRMISNLKPPPGSRWQGVIGFDMEWTVAYSKGRTKTGLIQLSDETHILLIQISSMKFMPSKLKAIITSPTILKVGVNIGNDMRRLCHEFGIEHAGRGILDLSYLAKLADVGLVGTRFVDLESDRAHMGIGVKKDQALSSATSADDVLDADNDLEKEDNRLDTESTATTEKPTSNTARGIDPADKTVRGGRILIQLARLSRRYLQRELEKGDERTSNWDVKLSKEQCRYAANDVHAGLAIYHSLRSVHARSVAAGLIPVLAPPPWEELSTPSTNSTDPPSNSSRSPAPPAFRRRTVPAIPAPQPEPQLVPTDQLQNLTPSQLESLLPWSDIVHDLRAEMDAARAAVEAKRVKEGVDIKGKGEAVVAAEAAAAAAAAKVVDSATLSNSVEPAIGTISSTIPTLVDNGSLTIPVTETLLPDTFATIPSKGMARALERQRTAEKSSEVMGKKWPPTRVTAPRIAEAASSSSSLPTTEPGPASPTLSSTSAPARPSAVQLRAYLLWYHRQLPLSQICAMMRSTRKPLEKNTVICHIVESLMRDMSLPFDPAKLKTLVSGDKMVKETYRVFLEGKLGRHKHEETAPLDEADLPSSSSPTTNDNMQFLFPLRAKLHKPASRLKQRIKDVFHRPVGTKVEPQNYSEAEETRFGSLGWERLGNALRGLQEQTSNVFPQLGTAAGALIDCLNLLKMSTQNRSECDRLMLELKVAVDWLSSNLCSLNKTTLMSKCVASVLSGLERQLDELARKRDSCGPLGYLQAEKDVDDLIECYRRIEILFVQLQTNASFGRWRIANEQAMEARLESMQPATQGHYDSGAMNTIRRRGCTPMTRQAVLENLLSWANSDTSTKVYWMNGMAGIGKTTVAYTLCSKLEETHQLAASFFCSREIPACRDIEKIVPTISYYLARFSPPFQDILCQTLSKEPDLKNRSITTQFETLLKGPLLEVKESIPSNAVIVIDALDECTDHYGVETILDLLLKYADVLPIKFFVTCRPDHGLLDKMSNRKKESISIYHLHHVDQVIVESDIETFLRDELGPVNAPKDVVKELAKLSGRLFIYAATVVRYICPGNARVDYYNRLQTVLGTHPSSSGREREAIDALYAKILSLALENEELEPSEIENSRRVLYAVICAKEPITIKALAGLLKLDAEKTTQALEPLLSVLYIYDEQLVSPLHASFSEYLLNRDRSNQFFCDPVKHNRLLAQRCFEVMQALLRFNICGLESSFVQDAVAPELKRRIDENIPPHLTYACRSWSEHLHNSGGAVGGLIPQLEQFLANRLLFWIETLNLQGCMEVGAIALSTVQTLMQEHSQSQDMRDLAQDAYKFATVVAANPVSSSTPHIYVSILASWSRADAIWKYYGARTQGLVKTIGPAIKNRRLAALATWRAFGGVSSVAVSRNGARIASAGGIDHGRICIWDARIGNLITDRLNGHTDSVCTVAFSPDGCRIVSGSADRTIRVWDVDSGHITLGPLVGHIDAVSSVAFSPNGSRIASGSLDGTINIWDSREGARLVGPLRHRDWVQSVDFSPDGKRICSGSRDCVIRVWDAENGNVLIKQFEGHAGPVRSVVYSPDGAYIASGSTDRTMRIWDAQTGAMLHVSSRGHTHSVNSVAFSPDGLRIASGSGDCTICIWDALRGDMIAGPFKGHTAEVASVAFSSDGSRIISGSADRTIRIWDGQSTIKSYNGWMCSAALFLPKGKRVTSSSKSYTSLVWDLKNGHEALVASGSSNSTIQVWDLKSGQALAAPFIGHSDIIYSVDFSLDGKFLVSGSADRTVCVWEVKKGILAIEPLEGHTGEVLSVKFSSNGRRIVSSSSDNTVRVWNAQDGTPFADPFEGHTNWVRSVSFCPNSDRVVSGSDDHSIRVWDVRNGNILAGGPLRGHSAWVLSVAFSPNGSRIVSGSADCTIRIWDAQDGSLIFGPFEPHRKWAVSVGFCSDGSQVVSGSSDGTVWVWDSHTSEGLSDRLDGHIAAASLVTFSPGGRYIVSCSKDDTLRLWDLEHRTATSPNPLHSWTMGKDGWITDHNSNYLWWVPLDLRPALKQPEHPMVISPNGSFSPCFDEAMIGPKWTNCFTN